MTHLRNQLDAAHREYQAARYAGDLASDIARLESRRSMRRLIFGGSLAAVAAIAACVVIVVHLRSSDAGSDKSIVAIKDVAAPSSDEDEGITFSVSSVPSWTDVGSPTALAPSYDSMVPPSWSVVPTTDTLSTVPSTESESGTNLQSKETT